MKNLERPTISDFIDKAGYKKENGKLVKIKTGKELEKTRKEEIEEIVNKPYFDPINRENYSNKKSGIYLASYSQEEFQEPEPDDTYEYEEVDPSFIDEFTNEDSLYNFTKKETNIDKENDIDYSDKIEEFENNPDPLNLKKIREEKRKKEKQLKSLPEYTNFEKDSLQKVVQNYINNKEQFIGEKKLSEKQINEAMDEFKQNFPKDFAKMVHRKLVSGDFKWKKEVFKGKNILVNYYPTLENPVIKYVLNLNDKNSHKKEPIKKVFISNSIKENGKTYRDKNGTVLIFCSKPKKILKVKK